MKSRTARSCPLIVITAFSFLISGCATPKPLTAQQADYSADKVDAPGIFLENCATCHGKNGRANTFHGLMLGAQNLTDLGFQMQNSDEDIRNAIKTGPGAMPAFRKKLSAAEIEALAAYVRTLDAGS